jgi:hypothetical protein
MSAIKPSIQTLKDLLNKPLPWLTDEEKKKLIAGGLLNPEKFNNLLDNPSSKDQERQENTNNSNSKNSINSANIFSFALYQEPQQAQKNSTSNSAEMSARQAAQTETGAEKKETKEKEKEKEKEKIDTLMGINFEDIENGEEAYRNGNSQGSHGGDPIGSTSPGEDKKDFGADSLLEWAKNNAKSSEEMSLADRVEISKEKSNQNRDQLDHYTDGQGIAQLGSGAGSGLNDREWFEIMRMQGDQFIGLARAQAGRQLSDQEARSQARELLIGRIKDYTSAGLNDGNLIGVLIGKGMSAEEYNSSKEEQARYNRYNQAKNGSYGWGAMTAELNEKSVNMGLVEKFTGIDSTNANLFTENLYYESYKNVDLMSKDLHYFKDKSVGFNLIFACDSSRDHNGALHMNHGSITGLAADDKNPTIVLSPRNDADMMKMIFRLSFIPKDSSIKGSDWLNRELNSEEKALMTMLAGSLSSEEKIKRFNDYLDKNGLEKNIGVANYMLKGHGWGGGIALHDNGTYDNGDKGIMALMGLSISAHVDQARIHQQSCSTAVGGEQSNIGVGNNTMNDFAPSTTKVVSVGANAIHWNGQGEHYQNVSWIHGNMVNEGQITEKQYYARQGLNTQIREEEKDALSLWTKNQDGIIVKKDKPSSSSGTDQLLASK